MSPTSFCVHARLTAVSLCLCPVLSCALFSLLRLCLSSVKKKQETIDSPEFQNPRTDDVINVVLSVAKNT